MMPDLLVFEWMSRKSDREHDECSKNFFSRKQNDTLYFPLFLPTFPEFFHTALHHMLRQLQLLLPLAEWWQNGWKWQNQTTILAIIGFQSLRTGFEQTCDRPRLFRFGLWRYFCLIYKTTQVSSLQLYNSKWKKKTKKNNSRKKKSSTSFQKSSWPSSFGNQSWLWAVSSLYRCTEIGRHLLTSERLVKGANLASELLRGMCHSRLDVNRNHLK